MVPDVVDTPRIQFGVEGFDTLITRGIPEESVISLIGQPGTGKTILSLQFVKHALDQREKAIIITLEQRREDILTTARLFGWDFTSYLESDQLAIIDLDPIFMAASLQQISDDLGDTLGSFGASRVVLDSVSLLEMMYDNNARRRREVYEFCSSLKSAGITTLLTSEASLENDNASRYGIVEYLSDATILLNRSLQTEHLSPQLSLEIVKIRNTNHSREKKPYTITDRGILVHSRDSIF